MQPTPDPGDAGAREPLPSPSSPAEPRPSGGAGWRRIWQFVPYAPALVPAGIVVGIAVTLVVASGLHNFGAGFFGLTFNSNLNQFGILVFVVGSFLTAVPALFFSMVIGLGIAIASTTYLPPFLSRILDPFVDLLAGIPSVVYGIWGFLVIAPIFGMLINPWAVAHLSFIPGFAANAYSPTSSGVGLPISIFVLTLMALPITTLLIRDALRSIPRDLWESGLALGATRWEVVRRVSLRYGSRGIWSAGFLGFGRAIGETVAVAMVIGSTTKLPTNVYDVTWTMSSFMFQILDAAFGNSLYLAALAELALILMAITLAVNLLGRRLVSHLYAQEVPGL
ncbi:MAG: phosphate ABC transporter permease subunit PstC [Thermoplasmata archaeon]